MGGWGGGSTSLRIWLNGGKTRLPLANRRSENPWERWGRGVMGGGGRGETWEGWGRNHEKRRESGGTADWQGGPGAESKAVLGAAGGPLPTTATATDGTEGGRHHKSMMGEGIVRRKIGIQRNKSAHRQLRSEWP